jgi:ligand-binding SRPBCC domain-containing protein
MPETALPDDDALALEPVCGEVLGDAGRGEQRRNDSCTAMQRGAGLRGNPLGTHVRAAVGFETVDIESEGLRESPQIGQLLATLAREQRSSERPEGALHAGRLGGDCGPPRRDAPRAEHEVAQIDPQGNRLQTSQHERAVRTRQIRVHHDQRSRGRAFDPRSAVGRNRNMRVHVLSRTHELEGTPSEVFPFFADAFNLEAITPKFLGFGVLTPPPIQLTTGAVIQYAMRLHGVPVTWTSSIQRWDPPHAFVDTQLRGPYRFWHHTHSFTALPGERTLMRDEVRYQLPFAPLSAVALPLVKRDLQRIFDYRTAVLPRELAAFRAAAATSPADGSAGAAPFRR